MDKHTPGPWTADCRSVSYKGGEWSKEEFLQWEVIGPETPFGRGDFYQADAYLIAAAPDGLSVAKNALIWWHRYPRRFDAIEPSWVQAARDFITKAIGEISPLQDPEDY